MGRLTLEISYNLVESSLKTGNIVKHSVVRKGLSKDSKLKKAYVNRYGNLELIFESEKTKEDKHIAIELTTLCDV